MAILQNAFKSHARTLTLINAFGEEINLSNADVGASPKLQASNGFELIRQLTLEYSIRTQSKAFFLRERLSASMARSLHCIEP